jgi:hypothetical protein
MTRQQRDAGVGVSEPAAAGADLFDAIMLLLRRRLGRLTDRAA